MLLVLLLVSSSEAFREEAGSISIVRQSEHRSFILKGKGNRRFVGGFLIVIVRDDDVVCRVSCLSIGV